MKTKLYTLLLSIALTVGLSACNEKWNAGDLEGDGSGRLSTSSLTLDVVNAEQVVENSRSTIDLSNFIITVYNSKNELVNKWTYSEMPELPVFPVGDYTVKVISHEQKKADWEAPYFEGSKDFTIKKDEITNIGVVTCKFAAIKVTIRFSDALKKASSDNVQVLVRANDEGSLVFGLNETRSGYFQAIEGSTTLTTTFTGTVSGYDEEIIDIYKDIAAGQHRIITYSLKNGNGEVPDEVGKIDPSNGGITVDVSVTDENLTGTVNPGGEDVISGETRPGQEVLPEDPDKPNPPVVDPGADAATFSSVLFPDFNTVYNATDLEGKDAIVNIHCEKGFAQLNVTIDSEGLTADVLGDVGLASKFDLGTGKSADGKDLTEGLVGLGFPVGSAVIGKTDLEFNITDFVPLLGIYPGMNNFIIEAVDAEGNKSSITLKIKS